MSENKITIVNPANLHEIGKLPVCNKFDLDILVQRARAAQEKWKTVSFSDRLLLFKNLKRHIRRNYQNFVSIIQLETGKTWPDAMVDVISAMAEIYNIEKNGIGRVSEFTKPVKLHPFLRNKKTTVPRRPKGIVGIISPWNLPLAIPAADIFPAIFRGNAVIWKPSEFTSLTALALKDVMRQIGFEDLLQVAVGYGGTGAAVCEAADCIVFTGSCVTGDKVKTICDRRRIPYHLEMGGKAPAIVLADADIDRAVYGLLYGAFSNNGHYCKAFEIALVHRIIFDEVVNRLLRLVNNLVPGKDYGPIITKPQLDTVKGQVEQARALGAYVATGGQEISGMSGYWYRPTVLLYAAEGMDAVRKETFGPVLPIIPFDDEEEAIRIATMSHLGLNASIFTRDEKKFYELANGLLADHIGNIVGNDAMINWFVTEAPQCGRKHSVAPACGLERHGRSGDERFDDPNTIIWHKNAFFHLPFFKNKEPWWLPYNGLTNLTLKAFLWGF